MKFQSYNIFKIELLDVTYSDILDTIDDAIKQKKTLTFHNLNFYVLLSSLKTAPLKYSLNKISFKYADGLGVYLAVLFLYQRRMKSRIIGTDLYYKILDMANNNGLSIFFWGGTEITSKLLPDKLKKYSNLNVKGILNRNEIKEKAIQLINDSNPDILFLGLGTPQQEFILNEYKNKINVPVQIAVGSGIDYISGYLSRAPKLCTLIGLEWLYRVVKEPRRLFKRYFLGIPEFCYRIFKEKISNFSKK